MEILELTLLAKEPLTITAGPMRGMAQECLEYIPGHILLGAFASAWINDNPGVVPDDDPRFQCLFLNGDVSWGAAYPLCGDTRCVPVPACFMREKNLPALPVQNESWQKDRFVVFNPLPLPKEQKDALGALYKDKVSPDSPPKFKKLPAGFMNPETFWQPDIQKLWNMRVALGKQRSALQGQLFGFSSLAAGLVFKAEIHCVDATAGELKNLLAGHKTLRVGSSRSSGCGLAALSANWKKAEEPAASTGQSFNIFLESAYYPAPAWENVRDNLVAALEKMAGQKAVVNKALLAHARMDNFNIHWQKWRDTRTGLAAGSVLALYFEKPVSLPSRLVLGGCQLEGYGRIMVNPEFLAAPMPQIPDMPASKPANAAPSPNLTTPIWLILRRRAIARLAANQAREWLHEENWSRFIVKAATLKKPTASQRANVMTMSSEQFQQMPKKTSGEQWRPAVCVNPFGRGNESLAAIMEKLLDPAKFLQVFPCNIKLKLPGGHVTDQEIEEYARLAYDMFKRELIRAWGKQARIDEKLAAKMEQ